MPWDVQKKKNHYNIIKADTGEVVGHSDSKAKAEASVRARYAATNDTEDWTPRKKKNK